MYKGLLYIIAAICSDRMQGPLILVQGYIDNQPTLVIILAVSIISLNGLHFFLNLYAHKYRALDGLYVQTLCSSLPSNFHLK